MGIVGYCIGSFLSLDGVAVHFGVFVLDEERSCFLSRRLHR